jgi:hypothetical protein
MATPDPYLTEIIDLTAERQMLYARQCTEPGDRDRLSEIYTQLEIVQRRRNVWRIGGDVSTVRGPLPTSVSEMREDRNWQWRSRRQR